jgi:hypothetical protein
MDQITNLVQQLIESRTTFFRRHYAYQSRREAITEQFLINEGSFLDLLSRILLSIRTPITFTFPINLPANFTDPVTIRPTVEQMAAEMEDYSGQTQQNCAICQDPITMDGCRLRTCGHLYHTSCIRAWFNASARCPICRRDIREDPQAQTSAASQEISSQLQSLSEEEEI